jgi:hypothetical protein
MTFDNPEASFPAQPLVYTSDGSRSEIRWERLVKACGHPDPDRGVELDLPSNTPAPFFGAGVFFDS